MVGAQRDHDDAVSVLRNVSVRGGIQHLRVFVCEPVPRLLDFRLHPRKRPAIVVCQKVPHILQQQHLRLVAAELPNQPDYVQKQQSSLIFKATLLSSNREGLARKSRCKNVHRLKAVDFHAQLFNRLVPERHVRKVQREGFLGEPIDLIGPHHLSTDFLKCATKAT